jgi:hypothetical protein
MLSMSSLLKSYILSGSILAAMDLGPQSPHTRYPRRYGIPIDGMYRFMEEPYRQVWPARSLTAFDPEACLAMKMKAYLSARLEGVLRGRDTSRQLLLVYVVV